MVAVFSAMVFCSHILFCFLAYVREDWWLRLVQYQAEKAKNAESEKAKKEYQGYSNDSFAGDNEDSLGTA